MSQRISQKIGLIVGVFSLGLVIAPVGSTKEKSCALHDPGTSPTTVCDDRLVLKRKKAPKACESLRKEEECGRWYSADAKRVMILRDVRFAFGKSEIQESSKSRLNKYVELMKKDPNTEIVIVGHADAVGSPEFNERLSEKRAMAVQKYFIGKGIAANRLSLEGQGEAAPIASNRTDQGRRQNRRAEMRLMSEETPRYAGDVMIHYDH